MCARPWGVKMKRFTLLLVLLIICLSVSAGLSLGQKNVTIPSLGTVSMLKEIYTLNRYSILFPKDDVSDIIAYFDMTQSHYYTGGKVQQIHSIRPDFKALVYRNIRAAKTSDPEYDYLEQQGWVLKDINGNFVYSTVYGTGYRLADIGNPDYRAWVASWIKENMEEYGFDGVFADNSLSALASQHFWATSAPAINPRTGTYWTDEEVRQALIKVHIEIKNVIGSKLLICNGIYDGKRFWQRTSEYLETLSNSPFDGIMSEGLWWDPNYDWYSETKWLESLEFMVYIQNNVISETDKVFVPVCKLEDASGEPYQLPSGSTEEQMATYAVASTMLGIKSSQLYLAISDSQFMETFGQQLFEKANNLGAPLGDYYEDNSVYVREFVNGKVYVNPTDSSHVVGGITIEAHTGRIDVGTS